MELEFKLLELAFSPMGHFEHPRAVVLVELDTREKLTLTKAAFKLSFSVLGVEPTAGPAAIATAALEQAQALVNAESAGRLLQQQHQLEVQQEARRQAAAQERIRQGLGL